MELIRLPLTGEAYYCDDCGKKDHGLIRLIPAHSDEDKFDLCDECMATFHDQLDQANPDIRQAVALWP